MTPRNLSLVKFDEGGVYPAAPLPKDVRDQYPFGVGEVLLFVGELTNMAGHCVLVRRDGKVLWGFHADNFVELTEEET